MRLLSACSQKLNSRSGVRCAETTFASYRTREGRRSTYEVNGALPLRHAVEGHQTLNALIRLILEDVGC
jgi:hypothetical protein